MTTLCRSCDLYVIEIDRLTAENKRLAEELEAANNMHDAATALLTKAYADIEALKVPQTLIGWREYEEVEAHRDRLAAALRKMLAVFGQDGLGDGAEGDSVREARAALEAKV